jgi:hypothetical protein
MVNLTRIATGSLVAAALGLGMSGVGGAVANAAPPAPGTQWAQQPWIGPGGPGGPGGPPGPGGPGRPWDRGPGFGGPPPPPPNFGYGGYHRYDEACLSGPLGFVNLCI